MRLKIKSKRSYDAQYDMFKILFEGNDNVRFYPCKIVMNYVLSGK